MNGRHYLSMFDRFLLFFVSQWDNYAVKEHNNYVFFLLFVSGLTRVFEAGRLEVDDKQTISAMLRSYPM
jgi:hypothetical protein